MQPESELPVPGLALIWAMDRNRTIGHNNTLPWHLPEDLAYFKKVTTGHPIVMGRRTFESIGRPLPGRENVVLTRDTAWSATGCVVLHAVEDVLVRYRGQSLFVIGGESVFRQFLPRASALYVTMIDAEFAGDRWFPEVDWALWRLVSTREMKLEHSYTYRFQVYVR